MAEKSEERAAAIDGLFALPLDEFTGARDELARRLRREGDRDASAEVKALRKPSVAAWALNRVRHDNSDQADELVEAGSRLREAQERLLAGGDRGLLEQAAADERRLVDELTRHAEREIAAAGRPASAAVQEKLRATLHAVASDPDARDGLATGRLVRDHEASGLGPFVAPTAPSAGSGAATPRKEPSEKASAAKPRREPSKKASAPKQRKEPSANAFAAAEREARRLEERLERARARQREADEKTAVAARRLTEARRNAARAAKDLERAEVAKERASRHADEATKAVSELERSGPA